MTLSFVPLGVGDAFSALYYSSCLAVGFEDRWILVDCPHPIRKMLRESDVDLDLDRVEAVALTHLHADHASGLEGYGYFNHFVLGRRAVIAANPAVSERLWQGHLAAGMERLWVPGSRAPARRSLGDYFELAPLDTDTRTTVGPFGIECRMTLHHVPTTAFRIHAGGRCLGYSADTAFDPSLIDWLAEADLMVHETNLGTHTPYEKLAGLSPEIRAKMRLIHYPDAFDRASSVIEPLRQGRLYPV
ncbi:MAG: MBL fold metallo-hydrolase [Sandaracinaceae bacterium]|nr:MAG: MBL fold metallo-hydrolase [Sandaracinaceae bacterium]